MIFVKTITVYYFKRKNYIQIILKKSNYIQKSSGDTGMNLGVALYVLSP